MQVVSHQGDSLDALCQRHLGSTAMVEAVLDANPGLAALGPILPMGSRVTLPDTAAARTDSSIIQLWD